MGHSWLTRAVVRDVCGERTPDARIRALATAQGGPVSHAQAVLLGASEKMVRVRRRTDRWGDLHYGVYVVGHDALTQRGIAIGALLSMPDGVLSHDLAAAVYCRELPVPYIPHVTTEQNTERKTIAVHRAALPPTDRKLHLGLPITTPARTALDCAESLPIDQAAKVVRELRVRGLVTEAQLRDQIARSPGRRGIKPLLRILDGRQGEPTQSWAEDRIVSLIAQTDLPQPIVNEDHKSGKRDLRWPEHKLIVELDAFSTHGDPSTFESDRARDNRIAIDDYETRRFTRLAVKHDSLRVLTTIAYRLGARTRARAA